MIRSHFFSLKNSKCDLPQIRSRMKTYWKKIIFRNRDRFYHLVLIQCEIHPFSDYKGTWKKCHVVCFHFSLTYCSRMLSTFHNGLKDVLNSHLNFSILSIFNYCTCTIITCSWFETADLWSTFICLVHKLPVVLIALDYKTHYNGVRMVNTFQYFNLTTKWNKKYLAHVH